ncbi:MAG: helix-turn-helix domain-containing protein [Dysgonamonadaceae bacterium]|jgi:transcriptional regulator with XRE-family HTH domain|nr:helix-turn-helix domain-containing protein [Dysgonamonadaceae bacterium]
MDLVKLGKNISAKRRLMGLKQEDVAFDIDISVTSYAKIERGETNIPFMRLVQIADYLKVEITELVREDNRTYSLENIACDIRQIKEELHLLYKNINAGGS